MLSLETCLKLKDAGWPQGSADIDGALIPSLEELLEAVKQTNGLSEVSIWTSYGFDWNVKHLIHGREEYDWCCHPELDEAVAALWLKLKAGSE